MNTVAGTARTRAVLVLTVAWLMTALALSADATASEPATGVPDAGSSSAHASIVNGRATSIRDWPWQVALAVSRHVQPGASPQKRTFCGGSLIAPDLVVTAGHCVADIKRSKVDHVAVISGRTHLNNQGSGEETDVKRRYMPTYASGKRKFSVASGAANWDVALLKLSHPVGSPAIRIAGNDERNSWQTGQVVKTTGWGITHPSQRLVENGLRLAGQVMQPEKICRDWDGHAFDAKTMVCFGAASIHSSACNGDSGGPLMAPVRTSTGSVYRLVGLTSYGDGYCRGSIPSVDSRVADQPMRGWVKQTALEVSGVDVVGHGGRSPRIGDWCRVPNLFGFTLAAAKSKLRAHDCRLGGTYTDRERGLPSGSMTFTNYLPGWLAKPGAPIKVGRTP